MRSFTHKTSPRRVVFGQGTISNIADEVAALGLKNVLILTTPQQAELGEALETILGERSAGTYAGAVMHTPVDVTELAKVRAEELGVDGFLSIGGGSTIGLGKALVRRLGVPHIVVPTTYAGSEMTPILGETKDGLKTTVSDDVLRPNVVVYDVDLTAGLPVHVSAVSGLNAIAHAVEALYARDYDPVIALLAREGIAALAKALPAIVSDASDMEARSDALYGAWLCSTCLGSVGMALHHKLCHTLGGSFGMPHAETHAIILPHAMAYNAPAVPEAEATIREVLQSTSAAAGLFDLATAIGAPTALRDIGFGREDIGRAVDLALSNPYWNPRPIEREPLTQLLENALAGVRPGETS